MRDAIFGYPPPPAQKSHLI